VIHFILVFANCTLLGLLCVNGLITKRANRSSLRILQAPRIVRTLGWIFVTASLASAGVFPLLKLTRYVWITTALSVVGFLFVIMRISLQIEYTAARFTVRRFFVSKTFHYDEIDRLDFLGSDYMLVVAGRKYLVDELFEGQLDFYAYAAIRYTSTTGDELKVTEDLLFNGYFLRPIGLLIGLLLLPILITLFCGMVVISATWGFFAPKQVTCTDFIAEAYSTTEDRYLVIQISDGEIKLPLEIIDNPDNLMTEMNNKKQLSAELRENRWFSNRKECEVWSLKNKDGTVLVSPETVKAYRTQSAVQEIMIAVAATALSWILFAGAINILNHAPDHPLLVRLLVKKSELNY